MYIVRHDRFRRLILRGGRYRTFGGAFIGQPLQGLSAPSTNAPQQSWIGIRILRTGTMLHRLRPPLISAAFPSVEQQPVVRDYAFRMHLRVHQVVFQILSCARPLNHSFVQDLMDERGH
jgi:hypothetical protein